MYCRFVEKFSQALKEHDLPNITRGNETVGDSVTVPTVRNLNVDNETRVVIFQHPVQPNGSKFMNTYITCSNVLIPPNSGLKSSTASHFSKSEIK